MGRHKDSRDELLAFGAELVEDGLYVQAAGVLVELNDDRAEEESLGHSAHATPAHAEHHNRVASPPTSPCSSRWNCAETTIREEKIKRNWNIRETEREFTFKIRNCHFCKS